ncbi:MAG TPA: phosphoribosyltransferase family protein [Polyangiaceae bacterium]|nr:phosphoribosyltransferase family protein [Polyangiaceae bacterium]
MRLRDRSAAGRLLAQKLTPYKEQRPVIMAVPCGGVPVGAEVASALRAPLDVAVVQKAGQTRRAEHGVVMVAEEANASKDEAPAAAPEDEQASALELERRVRHFRAGRKPLDVRGRTVILVDDGASTGLTCRAAIESLRKRAPARVVLAVPVMPAPVAEAMVEVADEVVCLVGPESLWSIGSWYGDFSRLNDDEASTRLAQAWGAVEQGKRAAKAAPSPAPRFELRWAFW